jgi:predicted dehydrogenase
MIKLATIGTSSICEWFLKAVKLTGRYNLEAVYSRSNVKAKTFADVYGFKRCFTDLNKMASDPEIDAVYIASPNSLHFEQCKLFLENKKHVICEKPIVLEPKDLAELQRIAKDNGVILMEALISVHTEHSVALKEAVHSLGDIKNCEFVFSKISSRWEEYKRGEFINVFEHSMGGGALYDLGVYPVYAAVFLFGEPVSVKSKNYYDDRCNNLHGKAELIYDGFSVQISYSKSFDDARKSTIIGEKGKVEIGLISMFADASLLKGDEVSNLSPESDRVVFMAAEANDFADYILGKKLCEYEYFSDLAVKTHKVMEKIYNEGE